MAAKQPPKNVKVLAILRLLWHGGGNVIRYNIPIGISEFEKIRKNDYYYVDKTELIQALVKTEPAEITLFTRPRRFGKTLVMSMLASFFDIRRDSRDLFEGLKIAEDQKLCELWMNQWPVIFLSLKDADILWKTGDPAD